jgi:hypothetical protein
MRRILFFLAPVVLFLALVVVAVPQQTQAQDRRCFAETGHCIEGPIRQYWERNGGLPVFGYPITDLATETVEGWTGPVQWFERDRLEDHGVQGVMAGRLGVRILELQDINWWDFPRADEQQARAAGCSYFPDTGHSMCEPFKSYWERNGGLERFGYPISEPQERTIDGWTGMVQYFERRRMEHHTEHAGTEYEVLLGLLGREVIAAGGRCQPVIEELQSAYERTEFAGQMGCAGAVYRDRLAAIQNLENGLMIWVQYSEAEGDQKIYAVWSHGRHKTVTDTWQEGDRETPDFEAPPGKFVPRRGFGRAWENDPEIREGLGWAVERNERAETATVQAFEDGRFIWLKGTDMVYVLGPNEWQGKIVTRLP